MMNCSSWLIALFSPVFGSELYGLRTLILLSMTIGSGLTGVILHFCSRGAQ